MHPMLRLARYARPHRVRFIGAVAGMAVYAAAQGALVWLLKPIVDEVLVADALSDGVQFGVIAAGILGFTLAKGIGGYCSAYLMTDVGQRVVRDLRDGLFRHILDQSASFFSRHTTGGLMSRMSNDIMRIQQVLSETAGDLLRESITVLVLAGVLVWIDARLALVSICCAPLVVYPLVRLGQRVRRTTRRTQEALERLSHITAEAFSGHRIVKAFSAEGFEGGRFIRASQATYRITMKVASTLSALPALMELIGAVGVVFVLWYGSTRIRSGAMSTGDFVAFVSALLLMYGPVRKLSRVNANVQQAYAASERVFEVMDTDSEVRERPDARPLAPVRSGIAFRDVGFVYDDAEGEEVLRGISFDVPAGRTAAIVGLSGAGKTTLVNLVPRFYDVTAGAILIDGVDIRDVTLSSLRASIGIVTQETILFDDTIANNIAYGAPGAGRAAIESAARAANAHEFIEELPHGYDTTIGERGQRLSGGQRQRLAIARALLRNAPILILDEATSSLDAESELLVQDALIHLLKDRTSFVIAHRLSTIRRADAIIVVDGGRVVETGRHEDLLADPESHYARLYAKQIFGRSASGARAPDGTVVA
ncbi:MAG: ABC transporter ATP-binding protein [Acidobacteria bacterium]|nr:ABC transporter ATP-binding protein [Acidobacteriota bacterium]MYJ03348.1 ABC transporter ATP-binding protein [Acidobacteriota bacterium]